MPPLSVTLAVMSDSAPGYDLAGPAVDPRGMAGAARRRTGHRLGTRPRCTAYRSGPGENGEGGIP